ncbi:hypothetical protein B5S31_g5215 [[Candida] boidinii]|nr:hypothetical protein B5S31_g5215 [[Candida] boidinii]
MTDEETLLLEGRIWIDGCFDFAHHGHSGAMLQARQQGNELYVGVHSDEEILYNKGPTVMKLDERVIAVDGCRWCTKVIPNAPYVTDPIFMNKYKCKFVVHGDDITTDANGEDCYKIVKDLGRFLIVKRTPNISTTDLVGRMLENNNKDHHLNNINSIDLKNYLNNNNNSNNIDNIHPIFEKDMINRFKSYASSSNGLNPGVPVYIYTNDTNEITEIIKGNDDSNDSEEEESIVYYIDGSFDLFTPGHIMALKTLNELSKTSTNSNNSQRIKIIVGIHSDSIVNNYKNLNYPIMNLIERSLCVLQSKYINGLILNSPYKPKIDFFKNLKNSLKFNKIIKFNSPMNETNYTDNEKDEDELINLPDYKYNDVTTENIVNRVLKDREAYEARQKRKGWKSQHEKTLEANEKSN